ncbi:hypothetical protein Drorol1_Dr00001184 [Drosera rotundifolia]
MQTQNPRRSQSRIPRRSDAMLVLVSVGSVAGWRRRSEPTAWSPTGDVFAPLNRVQISLPPIIRNRHCSDPFYANLYYKMRHWDCPEYRPVVLLLPRVGVRLAFGARVEVEDWMRCQFVLAWVVLFEWWVCAQAVSQWIELLDFKCTSFSWGLSRTKDNFVELWLEVARGSRLKTQSFIRVRHLFGLLRLDEPEAVA